MRINMKKDKFTTYILVLFISFCFLSCSKDDDNGLDSPIAQEIIGTWYASDTLDARYDGRHADASDAIWFWRYGELCCRQVIDTSCLWNVLC